MKIKEVCSKTGLTEKAVRYYVENGLCSPQEYESRDRRYLNFTDQNLTELKNIAVMRKLGFSTEDIRLMQDGGKIEGVMSRYIRALSEELEVKNRIFSSLAAVDYAKISSVDELMPVLADVLKPDPASPDFSKFEGSYFDDGAEEGFKEQSPKERLIRFAELFVTYSVVIGTLAALTTLPGIILLAVAALISRRFRADYMSMYQILAGVGCVSSAVGFIRSVIAGGGFSHIGSILFSGVPDFSAMGCRLYLIIAIAGLASLLILTFGNEIREKF